MKKSNTILPTKGSPPEEVLNFMRSFRNQDTRWKEGRTFSLVFYAGDELLEFLKDAYTMFFSENGLNPGAFPSLRRFEAEVIAMTANLLGGDAKVCGNMTSGGTESILMAVKTARTKFRKERPDIKIPEIVLPVTAHPAFDKAGYYFDVKLIHVATGLDFRADVAAMEAAITKNTIMMVGSAPQYPQGVVDPISELGMIARKNNILMHVDSCVGGFMLPFVKKLGYMVPDFDFSVPGVTSMSVDLHKYAYAAKGASIVLYKNKALRRHQYFVQTEWPGGIYASPSIAGTRPGGSIAAAWAVMQYLGEEGYMRINKAVMETAHKFRDGINAIDGIYVPGEPHMSVMSIAAEDDLNIYAIGDEMTVRGWHLDRQQFPSTLHLTVNWAHTQSVDQFLNDLKEAVAASKSSTNKMQSMAGSLMSGIMKMLPGKLSGKFAGLLAKMGGSGVPKRTAAMYGMMGDLPDRGDLHELVKDLLEGFTSTKK